MRKEAVVRTAAGCTIIVIAMGAFVAVVVFVLSHAMRATQPYKDIIARAQKDPRVVEALGAPVNPGWFVSGRIRSSRSRSYARLEIPLRGSKQNGSVFVAATQEGSQPWTYHRLLMTPDRGEPIDLLAAPPRTKSRAE